MSKPSSYYRHLSPASSATPGHGVKRPTGRLRTVPGRSCQAMQATPVLPTRITYLDIMSNAGLLACCRHSHNDPS